MADDKTFGNAAGRLGYVGTNIPGAFEGGPHSVGKNTNRDRGNFADALQHPDHEAFGGAHQTRSDVTDGGEGPGGYLRNRSGEPGGDVTGIRKRRYSGILHDPGGTLDNAAGTLQQFGNATFDPIANTLIRH